MLNLSKKAKIDLFELMKKQPNAFGENSDLGYLPFLNQIWSLRSMTSEDDRFTNAYEDIHQHTVNNNDWEVDFLFLDRLKLADENEIFNKFIETLVKPEFRKTEDEIVKFVLLINPYLEKEGHTLLIKDTTDGYPVYTIHTKAEAESHPIDLSVNTIPFFVEKSPSGWIEKPSSHTPPKVLPSFILVFNNGWNDFSVQSTFYLFYYNKDGERKTIGEVKIIYGEELKTQDIISNEFTNLDHEFCSAGQNITYYKNLKEAVVNDWESVLYALKDAAFFHKVHEKFEQNSNFKTSILRNDSVERLLRVAKYELYDYDLGNLYSFKFTFKPAYSQNEEEVFFEFETEKEGITNALDVPNRIYALIGKNGTGKTQLITSLPMKIAKKENALFTPRAPLFSKVIAVSYSVFDKFEIPRNTSTFNYVYCGLRNEENERFNEEALISRFSQTSKKISALERIDKWRSILLNFIEETLLDEFLHPFEAREVKSFSNSFKVDMAGFGNARTKMSSGQNIVLYVISEIVANIRYDSLLLYDEPETHLHPNAISQLMNTIYELVAEFKSYCIIATHSPLVVRELLSKNVYVIERENTSVSVRRIGLESFGENLTTLTDEVFGNKEIQKQYKKIITLLIAEGKTYQEIVSLLEFDEMPLSLNTRIFIKSQFAQNEES